jgi:aspartyl-tRNA(Asn)/glutamyl-tRNA(Gln) amidotransferase subunit B
VRKPCDGPAFGHGHDISGAQKRPGDGGSVPGATGDWEIVIGLEVHAQVTSKAKLFSGASDRVRQGPNSNVSLVDAAMPGMLPVINEECVARRCAPAWA